MKKTLPTFKSKLPLGFTFAEAKAKPKGFTLIELLIVITIIGILAAIGLVAYTNTLKSTRDSRRKADIATIQKALELYYQQNGNTYPLALSSLSTLLPAGIPTDPKTPATNYCFVDAANACGTAKVSTGDYKLCAVNTTFEVSPTPATSYCVTNQQ